MFDLITLPNAEEFFAFFFFFYNFTVVFILHCSIIFKLFLHMGEHCPFLEPSFIFNNHCCFHCLTKL